MEYYQWIVKKVREIYQPTFNALFCRVKALETLAQYITVPEPTNPNLLLIVGQSNALGRGDNTEASATELALTTTVQIWNTDHWEDLDISSGNNLAHTDQHGLELGFSLYYPDLFPDETLYIIKEGDSGTDIDSHLTTYFDAATIQLENAVNNLIGNGIYPKISILFLQGEADSNNVTTTYDYHDKLVTLINQYSSFISTKTPFVNFEIIETDLYDTIVNEAKLETSKSIENSYLIESSSESTDDNLHYNYTALKNLSYKFLKLLESIDVVPTNIVGDIVEYSSIDIFDLSGYTAPTTDAAIWEDNVGAHSIVSSGGKNQLTITGTTVLGTKVYTNTDNQYVELKTVTGVSNAILIFNYTPSNTTVRGGVVFRTGITGTKLNGYVFIRYTDTEGRLYRIDDGALTQLATGSIVTSGGTETTFKVEFIGIKLTVSQLFGTTWTQVLTINSGIYTTGNIGFSGNFGGIAGSNYFNDLTILIP